MKKLLLSLCTALVVSSAFAQSPQAFKYQAVARNASGVELAATAITVRTSIHDGSASGTAVYVETHSAITNPFGLFSITIGRGTVVSGSFSSIDWGNGAKYMEQEIDLGSGFQSMGTAELLSVPYALYAASGSAELLPDGSAAGNTPYWDGSSWVTNNSNIFNNGANVGIGTATPSHTLEVQGNSFASSGYETPSGQDYTYSTAKTHYLSIPATAFNVDGVGSAVRRYVSSPGAWVGTTGGSQANAANLYASVNLPDGATIKKVTAYILDNDVTNDASVWLVGISNATGSIVMAAQGPNSSASSITPYVTGMGPHVVNNSSETYSLLFNTFENDQDLQLYNVVIEYTVTKAD